MSERIIPVRIDDSVAFIDYRPNKLPYAYIQLHSSNICGEFHCTCGATGHVDAEFLFLVKCLDCNKVYQIVPYFHLREVEPEIAKLAKSWTE